MVMSEEKVMRKEILRSHIVHFLGVRVDNISRDVAVRSIRDFINEKEERRTRKIFFTNVHTIHIARRNKKFRDIVNNADLCLPDGSGLKIAGKLFSTPVKENLNGTDFTPVILKLAQKEGWRVYLFGAQQNVLIKCAARIEETYPRLEITGMHSGFFKPDELPSIIQDIKNSSPEILLVAMGSPLQETFIDYASRYLDNIVCMAVGGLFDFLSGEKRRAPKLVRKLGLEWAYRFLHDPKTKWDRIFIEIPGFLLSILVSRFRSRSKSNSIKTKLSYR